MPFFFDAAILSRMRSPAISRSNWAKESSMLSVRRPMEVKAVECLIKDHDDFPAEHCTHLRTTNPIESSSATVRDRTVRSKGCLSNKNAFAMIFNLAEAAEKNW